jgi:hypothetical protein
VRKVENETLAYDYSLVSDPSMFFQIKYKAIAEPVPPQHADAYGVTERHRIVLEGDDLELYVEKRKSDFRILLPNGMVQMCSAKSYLPYLIEGIAIGRIVSRAR